MRGLNRLRLAAALWLLASSVALPQTISGGGVGGGGYYAITQAFPNAPITGDTVEHNVAAIRIPANTLGATGAIRIFMNFTYPNSANSKILSVRFGASGITSGGLAFQTTQSTTVAFQTVVIIRAAAATNSQVTFGGSGGTNGAAVANNATSVDTTADSFVNINAQLGLGTETITLIGYTVEVMHP